MPLEEEDHEEEDHATEEVPTLEEVAAFLTRLATKEREAGNPDFHKTLWKKEPRFLKLMKDVERRTQSRTIHHTWNARDEHPESMFLKSC